MLMCGPNERAMWEAIVDEAVEMAERRDANLAVRVSNAVWGAVRT